MFSLGLLYLASYLGLVSVGRVEQELEWLAGNPDATSSIYQDTGQGEALFMVFAFLLLTPVAIGLALLVPLFISAAVAAFLNRATNLPVLAGTLLFWLVLVTIAYFYQELWWPQTRWFVNLVARGFLIAMQKA
jgi:hypothetical protein